MKKTETNLEPFLSFSLLPNFYYIKIFHFPTCISKYYLCFIGVTSHLKVAKKGNKNVSY